MENNAKILKDFMDKRFGMFIHWGVYSMLGGEWNGRRIGNELGEWIMNILKIPVKEYEKIAATFNPVNFDADAVVKLAKKAGMKYIVITAKHHDGFAMFHSECDKYNIVDWTCCKRDVIAELADACRKHDMKLGFYYSQSLDWHEEHAGGWEVKPNNQRISWGNTWDYPDNGKKNFSIYFEKKVKPQVKELLSNYGDVFLMWFDTPRTITTEQSDELYRLVKSLQPNCLINSRIGNGKGDYGSLGDNQVPSVTLTDPYESPVTLNDTWGYKHFDNNWKSSKEIIEMLIRLASRNVNLLLNIGPRGDGSLTKETVDILSGISEWTAMYGEAIFGTSGNKAPGEMGWGYITTGQNKIYLHIKENVKGAIELNGLKSRVVKAYSLKDGEGIEVSQTIDADRNIYSFEAIIPEPSLYYPVYVLECDSQPLYDGLIHQQGDTLSLHPIMGTLYDGKEKTGSSVFMGNIYLDYSHFGKMKINRSGMLEGWSSKEEYISWKAMIHKTGMYKAEIIINNLGISDASKQNCEISIFLNRQLCATTNLKEDFLYTENRSSSYNNYVGTVCKNIVIPSPGKYEIKLRLNKNLEDENDTIPLVVLRLTRYAAAG